MSTGAYPAPTSHQIARTAYTQLKPMQRSIARSNKLQGPLKQDPSNPEYRKLLSQPASSSAARRRLPLSPAIPVDYDRETSAAARTKQHYDGSKLASGR